MKTGLVMEGGAMRGLFTCGILDVFLENGVTFDGAIGVSAGAAFGCNFKSKQIGRGIRYNVKYCKDERYCSIKSLIKTGDLFGVDFCYRRIPFELDPWDGETFRNNPMEFYVVCADVKTGMPVYHKCDRGDAIDVQWFRASASLPGVSRIVRIDGKELLDGGMCDAVPLDYFRSIGYEKNVVILTQPEEYRKGKNKLLPFLRLKLWNYPNMVHALATRHNRYNAQIAHINELGKKLPGEVLILKPKAPLNVAGIVREPERLMNAYNAGREVGLKNLERVKAFLKD